MHGLIVKTLGGFFDGQDEKRKKILEWLWGVQGGHTQYMTDAQVIATLGWFGQEKDEGGRYQPTESTRIAEQEAHSVAILLGIMDKIESET